jgi:hypothetical protein
MGLKFLTMFAHLKSIRDWYSMKRAVHHQITKTSMNSAFLFFDEFGIQSTKCCILFWEKLQVLLVKQNAGVLHSQP